MEVYPVSVDGTGTREVMVRDQSAMSCFLWQDPRGLGDGQEALPPPCQKWFGLQQIKPFLFEEDAMETEIPPLPPVDVEVSLAGNFCMRPRLKHGTCF